MGSDWIMDPILQLVGRSSGIIDPTLGSMDMSGPSTGSHISHLFAAEHPALGQGAGWETGTDRGPATTVDAATMSRTL